MPEVECETRPFVTTELAILWCCASVNSHLTPRVLNSGVTELHNTSQNIMTMVGICHFDYLSHSIYFVAKCFSFTINMLHLKTLYYPIIITLYPLICEGSIIYYHNCRNNSMTSYYLKERFENFKISVTFHGYVNVVTRWHRRGKTFS